MPHILHVAAENDRLPGCKVGGMADVVRDIAPALADLGCQVTLLTPSYGYQHLRPGSERIGSASFLFRGAPHWADIYEVPDRSPHAGVRNCVIQHPWIEHYDPAAGRHLIYVDDTHNEPFFTDSSRFACFCAAAAAAIGQEIFGTIDALHLHDWHTALIALLRRVSPPMTPLRTAFTIHNLAIQGIRPLRHNDASLEAWFPGLAYQWIDVGDPQWSECYNPMATGIRLADMVHTVSPTYAEEICQPSRKPHFFGAERLESVIRYQQEGGRLIGILNGCAYPAQRAPARLETGELTRALRKEVVQWAGGHERLLTRHFVAYDRLTGLAQTAEKPLLLCSVSRVVDQKFLLMRTADDSGRTALQQILDALDGRGYYLLLGSGDSDYERFLAYMSAHNSHFIFLNGYSEKCSELLYANGDLFLMPSSFEPCGISQMLAMRDGQPCVVHAVGGLRDTVQHGVNGFAFEGATLSEQATQFVATTRAAMDLQQDHPRKWRTICAKAAAARFSWQQSARQYMEHLYGIKVKQRTPKKTTAAPIEKPVGQRTTPRKRTTAKRADKPPSSG